MRYAMEATRRLKMREWKTWHGGKCKGGKCGSKSQSRTKSGQEAKLSLG